MAADRARELTEILGGRWDPIRRHGEACCPAHDDRNPSLHIDVAEDGTALLICRAGCSQERLLAVLRDRGLWPVGRGSSPPRPKPKAGVAKRNGKAPSAPRRDVRRREVATYDYHDAVGAIRYQVVRWDPKAFTQRRPDPDRPGRWISRKGCMAGVEPLPYRLPEVLKAIERGDTILIVEGEKDADSLASLGIEASCNHGGAGKWRSELTPHFQGANIVLSGDNDEKGRDHVNDVGAKLAGTAASIRYLDITRCWPECPPKGDVSDWVGAGATIDDILAAIEEAPAWEPPMEQEVEEDDPSLLPSPSDPMAVARRFTGAKFHHHERALLIEQGGQFYRWDGTCWPPLDDRDIRTAAYRFTERSEYLHEKPDGSLHRRAWQPTQRKVADFIDALRAVTAEPTSTPSPSWLGGGEPYPASEIVACTNGFVHIASRTLIPHTPRLYVHNAVPFAFEPDAPPPARWLTFLDAIWGDDQESIDALQEWSGYLVSGDTSQQKAGLVIGPKRGGKGTIARVLTALLGSHHVAGPTLSSLANTFGLEPLIGKTLAIVSDARLGVSDTSIVAERLLSISGEDLLSIDRKHRPAISVRLPTRIMILSNELPRIADASGALAGRFIVLMMTQSFYGREDPTLTKQLLAELPAIFNWALDGAERLRQRGRFMQPESSMEAIREMEDLGSPISAFVRDRCTVGTQHERPVTLLYADWREWCTENGRRATTTQVFGRDLRAAFPGIRVSQARDGGERLRVYRGIGRRD